MSEVIYEDPIWEYALVAKLQPYLPAVKHFWEHYSELHPTSTGVTPYEPKDVECPPGLMIRMTNTPVRSPIKHVQAFPFVPVSYLQIAGVSGGVNKMVERICHKGLELEGLIILEKHNLPSTYQNGMILCFVPKDVLEGARDLGKYVYLTFQELCIMAQGDLPKTVCAKCAQYTK